MIYKWAIAASAALVATSVGAQDNDGAPNERGVTAAAEVARTSSHPDHGALAQPAVTKLLPNYGNGGFPIATNIPEAQAFFDNGIELAFAFGQQISAADLPEPLNLETGFDQELNEPGSAFDILARSFSKKKRSEMITLKTFTDDKWAQAEDAVKANLKACDKGDATACKTAGDAYAFGDGVWPMSAIAYLLDKESCDAGVTAGCIAFFDLAQTGYGYPEGGYEESHGLLERACDLGDLIGCDKFADALRNNSSDPSDIARSDAILERACMAGGEAACQSLSWSLRASGRPEDQAIATAMFDTMCRKSVLPACQAMAAISKSKSEPDEWLDGQYIHLSCYLESAWDCAEMGRRAYQGNGIAKDRNLALAYYDKACQIDADLCDMPETLRAMPRLRSACTPNDAQACADLGSALADELSPEFSPEKALELLLLSCRSGLGNACGGAAEIIGLSDIRDDSARQMLLREMLEKGCEADNADACFTLAQSLEKRRLGTTNLERAVALYSRLCDAKFPDACAAEGKHSGFIASARIAPADESFIPPLPSDTLENASRPLFLPEVCFTGSERFRGKAYTAFQCDRGEKGIGSQQARPGQAPWQALLWRPEVLAGNRLSAAERVLCGGSLIAQGWVLTAAHCLNDNGTRLRDGGHRVRLGVYNPRIDEGVSYPILRTIPHPRYDSANKYVFDIALIQYDVRAGRRGKDTSLGSARQGTNSIFSISLDPLDIGKRRIEKGMPVYSYGWCWTEAQKSQSTDYLQIVQMELGSESACTALTGFKNNLSNAALCAGGKKRQQTCYGDSGGPLVFYGDPGARPTLVGVVSAGRKCGTTGRLSQYTRVAKVKSWIQGYVRGIR